MNIVSEENLFQACRVLFGPEAAISRSFLYCLQPSGISNAFRRRALETHPDRFAMMDEESRRKGAELFIEADRARSRLLSFCRERDGRMLASRHRRKRPVQGSDRKQTSPVKLYSGSIPQRRLRFGEFLYYSGIITWHAFVKAIVWQRRQRPRFGDIARRWRYLSEQDIRGIITRKRFSEPIGEAAVRIRFLSQFQVNTILFHQMFSQRPIGEYFVENGFLTKDRVDELLAGLKQHNARFSSSR